MTMNRLVVIMFLCAITASATAQQALGMRPNVKSPIVNSDGTVTFNFFSPKAQEVSVTGDFEEIHWKTLPMTKQDNGVWTVTTSALNPELYSYSFSVDGQRIVQGGQGTPLSGKQRASRHPCPCVVRQSHFGTAAPHDGLSACCL